MSEGVKFPDSIKNGAKRQKIIYIENGERKKFIGSPEEVFDMYNRIHSDPQIKWKGIWDFTLLARIKRFFREIKKAYNETCRIGPIDKEGDQ